MISSCNNCFTDRFTDTLIGLSPFFCQVLFCLQAVLRTHSPMGRMSPVFSASGMNFTGDIDPRVGWFHLKSASTPMILFVDELNWGCYIR